MSSYKQWAAADLCVGPYPNHTDLDAGGPLSDLDVFINVSDEYRSAHELQLNTLEKASHWFPMGEQRGTMPLASIFAALVILRFCETHQLRVYLHCAAGINRSQTVADCYHYLREEGLSHRDKHTVRAKVRGLSLNTLQTNCEYGVLPPLVEVERWLLRLSEQFGMTDTLRFDYSEPPVFV